MTSTASGFPDVGQSAQVAYYPAPQPVYATPTSAGIPPPTYAPHPPMGTPVQTEFAIAKGRLYFTLLIVYTATVALSTLTLILLLAFTTAINLLWYIPSQIGLYIAISNIPKKYIITDSTLRVKTCVLS